MTNDEPVEEKGVFARAAETVAETVVEVAGNVAETVVDVASQAGAAAGRLVAARRERRRRRPNPREPIRNLYEVHPEARTAPRRELGVLTIPVDQIRGTAVEGAAQRGADFLPLPGLRGANWRGRWQRLRAAQDRLAVLPPIDVLQTDEGYWVLDGHNRVALARQVGQDDIDAAVTHVHLPGSRDADLPRGSLATILADSLEVRGAARGAGVPALDPPATDAPTTDPSPTEPASSESRPAEPPPAP